MFLDWQKSHNWLILDVETTGLDKDDEVIELSLIDSNGNVLYDSLFNTEKKIKKGAYDVHGISSQELTGAPFFYEEYSKIKEIIENSNQKILIFNKNFDVRLLSQTCSNYGLDNIKFDSDCVMNSLSEVFSLMGKSAPKTIGLGLACEKLLVSDYGINRHRALGDCELVRRLILDTSIELPRSKTITLNDSEQPNTTRGIIIKVVNESLKKECSFTELSNKLKEKSINLVLTGPNSISKTFNGIRFVCGDEDLSGSEVSRNHTFQALIKRGISYSELEYEFFDSLLLSYIESNQEKEKNKIFEKYGVDIRGYKGVIKTVFRSSFEFSTTFGSVIIESSSLIRPSDYSQTKLIQSKPGLLMVRKIDFISLGTTLNLVYSDIYEKTPCEIVCFDSNNKKIEFKGEKCFNQALRYILNNDKFNDFSKLVNNMKKHDKCDVYQLFYTFPYEDKISSIPLMINDLEFNKMQMYFKINF